MKVLGWVHLELHGIRYTIFATQYTLYAILYTGMAGYIGLHTYTILPVGCRQHGFFRRRRCGSSFTDGGWGETWEEKKNMGTTALPNETWVGGVPHHISEPDRSSWWDGVFQLHADVIQQLQNLEKPNFTPHQSHWIKLEETSIRRRKAGFDH